MEVHKGIINSIERDIFEKKIITSSSDGLIRIFENKNEPDEAVNLQLECELDSNHGASTKAIFVHHWDFLASSYSNGMLVIWKKENNNSYIKVIENLVFTGSINDICAYYLDNVIKIYCACSDGKIRILNFNNFVENEMIEIMAHKFGVSTVAMNNKYIVSGGLDYSVVVWENNQEIIRFRDHSKLVRNVCVAPDNVFNIFCFASCGEDCKIFIYWKHKNDFLKQEIILDEPVYSLSWSKSGFTLSVGYGNNKFKCYEPGKEGKYEEVELKQEN